MVYKLFAFTIRLSLRQITKFGIKDDELYKGIETMLQVANAPYEFVEEEGEQNGIHYHGLIRWGGETSHREVQSACKSILATLYGGRWNVNVKPCFDQEGWLKYMYKWTGKIKHTYQDRLYNELRNIDQRDANTTDY